jgi:hypothetical protein
MMRIQQRSALRLLLSALIIGAGGNWNMLQISQKSLPLYGKYQVYGRDFSLYLVKITAN